MIRKILKKVVAVIICTLLTLPLIIVQPQDFKSLKTYAASNEEIIYNFLKNDLGLNTAAACGVLANIEKESSFRNDVIESGYTWETGGGYGICQWTNDSRGKTGR